MNLPGSTVLHINIRSIQKKINEILIFLKPHLSKIDIIILSETRFNEKCPYSLSIQGHDKYFITSIQPKCRVGDIR